MPFLNTTSLGVLARPPVLRAKRTKHRGNAEGKRAAGVFLLAVTQAADDCRDAIAANVFGAYDHRDGDFVRHASLQYALRDEMQTVINIALGAGEQRNQFNNRKAPLWTD